MTERDNADGNLAAERQTSTSTSGHEGPVTFRSLGITEWLDRYLARLLACSALYMHHKRPLLLYTAADI